MATESVASRRNLLTGAVAGVAGFAAGAVSAGAIVGSKKGPQVFVDGRARFKNKVILITGATSGIGAVAAKMFAAEGGKVAFCGRRTDRGAEVESEIKSEGGEAKYIRADVRIEDDVRRFVDTAAELYGGLDICFNNAGITIEKPLHECTAVEWDDVVNTDLRGNFFALKYEIPHLIKRGGGVVVGTASSNAIATTPKRSAYSAAKRGLVGMVQATAQDYADNNIRINTLVPGTTDTEFVRRAAGMMNAPDPVWKAAVSVWAKSNVAVAHRLRRPQGVPAPALITVPHQLPLLNSAPARSL